MANSGISGPARCKIQKRCKSRPALRTKPLNNAAPNLKSMPLKKLKNMYTDLNIKPQRELSFKKSTSKNKRGSSVASQESRKETINLIVNQPNTALQILLREASPHQITGSPPVLP